MAGISSRFRAMELFIDTNVLLSFYDYSGDDLEELQKLVVLLQNKKVQLWMPEQVMDEFRRNRGNKLSEILRKFKDYKTGAQFPQISKDYPEYAELRELHKQSAEKHAELLNKIEGDIEAKSLKADKITGELMDLGKRIPRTPQLVGQARLRHDIGNPPGKSGSLGDAINWESLLATVQADSDLHFISGDKDFASALDGDMFDDFLATEWMTAKKSSLFFYKRLSAFFKEHFPDIQLAVELEKELLIEELENSGNFKQTHQAVAKLKKYTDFSIVQRNDILRASVENNQIALILDDEDVRDFLQAVVMDHLAELDSDNLELLGIFAMWYEHKFEQAIEHLS